MRPLIIWSSILLSSIVLSIIVSMCFLLLTLLLVIIISVDKFHHRKEDSEKLCIGFGIFPLKEVFSIWGKFYIKLRHNKEYWRNRIYIYKDNIFYYKEIGNFTYNSIDDSKKNINSILGEIYGAEVSKKNKIMEIKNELRDWNGSIDKVSDRDKKIKDIL